MLDTSSNDGSTARSRGPAASRGDRWPLAAE